MGFLLCMLKGVAKRRVIGSKIDWCTRCKRAVLIAPAGRSLLKQHGLTIICNECG
jgi:hypothetical protein